MQLLVFGGCQAGEANAHPANANYGLWQDTLSNETANDCRKSRRLAEYYVMPVLNQVQDIRQPSGEGMGPETSSG